MIIWLYTDIQGDKSVSARRESILLVVFIAASVIIPAAADRAIRPGGVGVTHPAYERTRYRIPVSADPRELKHFFALRWSKAKAIARAAAESPLTGPEDLAKIRRLPEEERVRIAPFLTFEPGPDR